MANKKYTTRALVLSELPGGLPGTVYQTTTLGSALSVAGTIITLASLSGFPDNGDLLIDSELIAYEGTSAAATTVTALTRGAWNTTAGTHANAASVSNAFIDRRIEKMTAYVDTYLSQRYQAFPSYSATGSCPETIEMICRNLSAHEVRVKLGILRNVGEGDKEDSRYRSTMKLLDSLAEGKVDLPVQSGTDSLAFGTSGVGTLPYSNSEAPLSQRTIVPETVLVTNSGTRYVNGGDFDIHWHEDYQKWILSRADSSKIPDSATASYDFSWLKSWQGKSPIDQQKGRLTNQGLLLRG